MKSRSPTVSDTKISMIHNESLDRGRRHADHQSSRDCSSTHRIGDVIYGIAVPKFTDERYWAKMGRQILLESTSETLISDLLKLERMRLGRRASGNPTQRWRLATRRDQSRVSGSSDVI
jgi:hypothetical protein